METQRHWTQKRLRDCAVADGTPISLQTPFSRLGEVSERIAFQDQQAVVDASSYGHSSALDAYSRLQPRNTPSKRRKSGPFMSDDIDCNPPFNNSISMDNNGATKSGQGNVPLPMVPQWPYATSFTPADTISDLPKWVAMLVCGTCNDEGQAVHRYPQMRGACPKVYGPTEPYCAEKTPLALNYDDPGFRLGSTPNRINSLDSTSTELLAPHVTMECPRGASGSEYFPSFASNLDPLAQSESLLFDFSDTSCDAPRSDYELHPSSMPHGLQISISANNALDAFVTDLTHAPPAIEQSQRMCKQQTLQRNSIHPVNTNNIGFTEHIWTTPSTIRYGNFDILLPNQRVGKRGAFRDSRLRKETAQTRKIGSCIRCRMQRIRCEYNPDDPTGGCLTCRKVCSPRAGRFPCLRYKITDVKMYKPGQVPGFEWTRRWSNNISVPIQTWASVQVKTIRVSAGYSKKSMQLQVRRFVPLEGDKLDRTWDFNGTKQSAEIPPYALMNLDDGKDAYLQHIHEATSDTMLYIANRSGGLIRMTYLQAYHVYQDPSIPDDWRELLDLTFRLWMAIRLSTTSGFIVGSERLGMPPNILPSTSPTPGRIPFPPVLGAQLDLVLIHYIQTKLRHNVLEKLQRIILKNKQSGWFVTYVVTFLLLHNAAMIIAHDESYARKHGMKRRFAREEKVQEYYLGANILLAHFHYCNKGWYPFATQCIDRDLRGLAELDDQKVKFVKATRKFVAQKRTEWQQLQGESAWRNDYFFISQLFEESWHPRTAP